VRELERLSDALVGQRQHGDERALAEPPASCQHVLPSERQHVCLGGGQGLGHDRTRYRAADSLRGP
jgi:hypothetical protein